MKGSACEGDGGQLPAAATSAGGSAAQAQSPGRSDRHLLQQEQQPPALAEQRCATPGAGGVAARAAAAAIARHSCDVLALPSRVASTALTFLHRLQPEELPPERLACTCIFLAAKVEEASVRTNDLVNAVAAAGLTAAGDSGAAAIAAFPCLVGDVYQQRKRQLIQDEQLVLRRLRFDICAEQPHRHLYVLAHFWGASSQAVRVATCLLNDCLCCCPAYGNTLQPATAAAAALHLGAQLCGEEVHAAAWWRATGISDAHMAAACQQLLDMVDGAAPAAAEAAVGEAAEGVAAEREAAVAAVAAVAATAAPAAGPAPADWPVPPEQQQ